MRIPSGAIAVLSSALALSCAESKPRPIPSQYAAASICSVLRAPGRFSGREIVVYGTYRAGFEVSEMYCLACTEGAIPWVGFVDDLESRSNNATTELGGTVNVTFKGHFETGGRYGHLSGYSSQFTVTQIVSAERISKSPFVPSHLTPSERAKVCRE